MPFDKTRVAILFGGRSSEHEVSIRSAASVIAALDAGRYEAIPIAVERSGRWLNPVQSAALLPGEAKAKCSLGSVELHHEPGCSKGFDVVFPVLHGPFGEDGRVQGLLDLADVPYVGSGVLGSACGMDKDVMKGLLASDGIPTLKHVTARWGELDERVAEVEEAIGYPAFVKPANLGSSVGIRRVIDRRSLADALAYAAEFDDKVIVEPAVVAREIECGVLGNEDPEASVPGEIVTHGGFYDYETKYLKDTAELHVPATVSESEGRAIRNLAVRAYKALGCAGLARVDFFIETDSGTIWVNEVNTMPGFTSISMYPRMWEFSGVPYPTLIERLIDLGFRRHQRNRRIRFDRG